MKNIYLILFLLVLALVSCDQENMGTIYEPGSSYVAFSSSIVPENLLTAENNYSVSVQIVRSDASAASATVELEMNDDIQDIFNLESTTITFQDGENVAYAKIVPLVNPSLIDVSKTYEFNLTLVGDNASEFYNETTYRAFFLLTFKPYTTGTFSSEFFGADWPVEIEKAEEADVFRIIDCYVEGYDITFSVDSENNVRYSTQEIGYVDPDYGMVSLAMPDSEGSYYYSEPYKEGNSYYLLGRMLVEAGSYGHWYEFVTMD